MALINATSFAGILLLLYLSSFVLLAILRIVTGVSIQRVGYFSLRHITFTPREGLRIDIRGIGLTLHRPTFTRPTWVSLRLTELKVTVDPAVLDGSAEQKDHRKKPISPRKDNKSRRVGKSGLWEKLTEVKEKIKRIHRKIRWLRMLDINAVNTSLEVVGVGLVHMSSFTVAVHTRRKLLDRGRLFRHKKDPTGDQKPAEWIFTFKSIVLSVNGREPVEVLDTMSSNVHGLLYKEKEGLRDTSIAIKLGRLYIPLDDALLFRNWTSAIAAQARETRPTSPVEELTLQDVAMELDKPGSREAAIVQTVADSKDFFSSILHSVQEIQLAMSFMRISKEVDALRQANLPLIMNLVTHEIGVDLHRMDQNSPAHRMYFSREDVAHQALVAAISISVSLDEDDSKTSKIMYIPMATTTIRTTLPAKTMSFSQERDVTERNKNILFANLVVTSPSVDLVPQHLIQLLALARKWEKSSSSEAQDQHRLISRLLPKASIKLSIHEPVVRFVLPVADQSHAGPGDYDMIISAISSISMDVESSHSTSGNLLYSLASTFRVVSHQLYYQAAQGTKHNLVLADSMEMKAQVTASTEVLVVVSGSLRTFSILMVREEVSKGVYNIVRHFNRNVQPEKLDRQQQPQVYQAFLRRLPPWLLEFHFEGTDCSIECAGIDKAVSPQTRGVAFQLESWTANYHSQRTEQPKKLSSRRRISASVRQDENLAKVKHLSPPASPSKQHPHAASDGRRLAFHVKGLEGFIIESLDNWEPQPFASLPRFEVAFSTGRDMQGPVFHINSAIRAFYLEFSLYKYYSIGVAGSIIQDAFVGPPGKQRFPEKPRKNYPVSEAIGDRMSMGESRELVSLDLKASYVQIKAKMPADPSILLQVYEIAAGRHRWSPPFIRAQLLRFHAAAPHVRGAWARLVSVSNIRVDIRHNKKKTQHGLADERSVDVSTDFVRIGVPHGLRMYKVFDNLVNTAKASTQLHHRVRTRTNEYILNKGPEGPKNVPRVSLRSKALMFELEDDPFEWKLGVIHHVGRVEQKQRLARAEAFKLKVKRTNEERNPRNQTRRAQSTRRASPKELNDHGLRRSKSQDSTRRARSGSRNRRAKGVKMRYDRDGTSAITGGAKVAIQEAQRKLDEHNARSWKTRIDRAHTLQSNTIKNIRRMFTGADEPPHDADDREITLGIPDRPGLMTMIISDLHLLLDKPSFSLPDLPKFLHDIGKGMPYDQKYALLVPVSIALDMGEARVMLRDYPLNLLHVPAIRHGQPPRLPSWSLRTDFVIAEAFRGEQSIRHVRVDIVPPGQHDQHGNAVKGFSVDVRRTVSPVKTFSKPIVEINTSLPTTISWGTSYQPVIQDMMMIIEGFTKPEIDPSNRVGFWDKIRLSFHSRLTVNWKGDGDLQLRLKGTRDPYVVTGYGAGFVMCWRNDVQWSIHSSDEPRRFMTVRSGEYVLAIPDYSHEARSTPQQKLERDSDSISNSSSNKNGALFQKVIMKVSGNVQWAAGLVFERDLDNGKRSSEFRPHYDVVLKNPAFMSKQELTDYDAFRGFRSQHIHLSLEVAAPFDRDWKACATKSSESYNSVHLSPKFFSHFFNWWSQFSGVMALPIRQGALWKGLEKSSKKFGRHLATIKYGLLLSPLYIAHVYKHKDAEDYKENVVSATGLKLRIDSFMLDLHQRREYFDTLAKGKAKQMRTSAMKIDKAELDFISADLRAVAASIAGTTAADLKRASSEMLSSHQDVTPLVDMSQFTIPDHDYSWIDMDDFVELDWLLPSESNPQTKILPLAFTPRFTYFRQTDHGDSIQGDNSRTSPFGNEDTHFCIMSNHNDPRKVQMDLISHRIEHVDKQLESHNRLMDEQELRAVRDGEHDHQQRDIYKSYITQQKELQNKRLFLQRGLQRLAGHHNPGDAKKDDDEHRSKSTTSSETDVHSNPAGHVDMDGLYSASHDEFASDFSNRFIVHNAQLKWNNSLRNIILRYAHQVSQRRGFVYYMSRRAVKFILDIVDEQAKAKGAHKHKDTSVPSMPNETSPTEEKDEDRVIQDRIDQLLNDGTRFVNVSDVDKDIGSPIYDRPSTAETGQKIADNFEAMNSYHMRLIAPQVQLQSEKNLKSVVLVSAKGMQLKVISIMDKARMSDDVSGLVQRRFALDMDGAQFFVAKQKILAKYLHLYAGNRYGNPPGSSWPPWVSIEAMFDFQLDPFGFQRVIQKTSASLRYEKYNQLRLKYNEEVHGTDNGHEVRQNTRNESRIDHLWVDFPRLRASCDSTQYYAMYIIALDLLMYSEPLEKTRNERLEKIMLASDFSDLRGAPEMAERLQERIHQLEDIKLHFQINAKYLDIQGWEDRINVEKDLASCEDELFFIMKAINTSQQKNDDRKSAQSSGLLRWYLSASEIVWHLMRDKNEPLLEFQLRNAAYERIDNNDGSNHNAVEIQQIRGWNLLSNALYPEIIGPYHDPAQKHSPDTNSHRMLQVHWYMLEAIAGIPVLEQFKVTMFPLKVQLERELGQKLFEYIFPGVGANSFDSSNFSPLMVKNMEPLEEGEDSDEEEVRGHFQPEQHLNTVIKESARSSSPGAMSRRLKPTYNFDRPTVASATQSKNKGLGITGDHRKFFRHNNSYQALSTSSNLSQHQPVRKTSASSLRSFRRPAAGSHTSLVTLGNAETKKLKEGLQKASSTRSFKKSKKPAQSDDLSQMITRASNYMTLAHVKLNSFVICLSYKGKADRNLEDLHDFVFRMPTLEYRNKTWSNLDLALRLKKDVIRALISHTGAIIGNKISHHRPSKKQVDRHRELASHSVVLPNSDTLTNTTSNSENASLYSISHISEIDDFESPRASLQSVSHTSGSGNGHPPPFPTANNSPAPPKSLLRSDSWSSGSTSVNKPPSGEPHTHDPLAHIRPSTAVPMGRSLLKSTLGRHFSSDTVKGRMAHLGATSGSAAGKTHGRKDSGDAAEGTDSDVEGNKRKSMLLLGKKVWGKLDRG